MFWFFLSIDSADGKASADTAKTTSPPPVINKPIEEEKPKDSQPPDVVTEEKNEEQPPPKVEVAPPPARPEPAKRPMIPKAGLPMMGGAALMAEMKLRNTKDKVGSDFLFFDRTNLYDEHVCNQTIC